MPVYNVMPNCFKNTSDGFKSSNDRIEKLKAKTIYHSSKNTSVPRTSDGSKYNGPVFINTCGFLGSIGGFNNSNYNLRLNVAKGRAYSEKQNIITQQGGENIIFADQELCNTSTSKAHKANKTYDLLEGNFYSIEKVLENNSPDIICNYEIIKDRVNYSDKIIASGQSNNTYVSNLVNRDKLHNLNLNKKIQMCP
tara:strand:+ start:2005 stop:2589 length:585 start_codon:yes stop_codon:yes gene_type:complete